MKKKSKKQRIKELENAVLTLSALFDSVISPIPSATIIKLEDYSIFENKLRETEAKYASKAS